MESSSSPSGPSRPRAPRRETFFLLLLLLLIGGIYYGSLLSNPRDFCSPKPNDYYGLLTEAFHAGQLHLKLEPDPRLLALENPYAGPQGSRRPHDMSFYRGRFYLYYGATPALILFLPWRLITGGYLAESAGAVLMLYAGFVVGACWLAKLRLRFFPELPFVWLMGTILIFGLGPPLLPEASNHTFYLVPIAGGFLCLMVALTAVTAAVNATRLPAQAGWLALASLAGGLAVGSRPIYVLGLTALVLPAGWLWWRSGSAVRWRWPGLRLLAATVIPAAIAGIALCVYNYLRFDDPLDFGIRFSLASGDIREAKLVGLEFIPKNFRHYLLNPAPLIRYFPFMITGGRTWGVLPHHPFTAVALLLPLTWLSPILRRREWVLPGLYLLMATLANFGMLCLFFGGEERYLIDFVPALVLVAGATAMVMIAASRDAGFLAHHLPRIAVVGVGIWGLFTGTMLALDRLSVRPGIAKMAQGLNRPAGWFEQWRGEQSGPLEMEVVFPKGRTGTVEPLVSTGYSEQGGDIVSVRYSDEDHVQFQAFHLGRGGPLSEPVKINYDVPHRLRLVLGSLYPPPGHPGFAGWSEPEVARVRHRLRLECDGQTVLQGNFMVYPSSPAWLALGRNTVARDLASSVFSGRILSHRRLGVDQSEATGFAWTSGPVRMTVRFPPRVGDEGLPLVSAGTRAAGDLIFAQMTEDGAISFGHDSWGAGAVMSPAVPIDLARDHVVDIEMGSLLPVSGPQGVRSGRLRIVFDGAVLLDIARPFHRAPLDQVEFGFNSIQASSGIGYFPGAIRSVEHLAPAPPSEDRTTLRGWGPLRLAVEFPLSPQTRDEPLCVVGETGKADILFVRYEAGGQLRFGVDHWAYGVSWSAPFAVNRSLPQLIEIRSGGLLPPTNDPAWAGRTPEEVARLRSQFEVRLAGNVVLEAGYPPYLHASPKIALGENYIGASSCGERFGGRFLVIERPSW